MASSSSPRPRDDNSANSPNNSKIDIDEHDEGFAIMASSSLPLSEIDESPNNLNCSSISPNNLRESFEEDVTSCLELYQAVLNGDWKIASIFLKCYPKSISARIETDGASVLHIAVELGVASMGFVEKLVEFMPSEELDLRDSDGATALTSAARAGNIKAAKLLVNKKPSLPNSCQRNNLAPLHSAVRYGHKELTLYLLGVTRDDVDPSPFSKSPGFKLLHRALMVFHDVALYLVKRYPHLATCHFGCACHDDAKDSNDDFAPLTVLAKRPWAFRSGSRFNLWQLIIYHC
nr:hypothetical protein VITISV_011483 [Vitis vinifera]